MKKIMAIGGIIFMSRILNVAQRVTRGLQASEGGLKAWRGRRRKIKTKKT